MKKRLSLLWIAALAAVLAACGSGGAGPGAVPAAETGQGAAAGSQAEQSAGNGGGAGEADAAFPLTLTDASGTELTFERPPERIVSIAPSATEVLFAVGAGERVVAVDDWSNDPAEAAALPKVGGLEANVEAILEHEPDLVMAGWSMSTETVGKLRELGLTVYTFDISMMDEVIGNIREVGAIVGETDGAEAVVAKMEADRKRVTEAVAGLTDAEKKRVYIEFSEGWTVGKGEYMDELLTMAGGVNVAERDGWYEMSGEAVIEANPEVILYSARVPGLKDIITGRSGWDKIDAIANGQVIGVDDNLFARPGPRLTDGLLVIAQSLYPDKFPQ